MPAKETRIFSYGQGADIEESRRRVTYAFDELLWSRGEKAEAGAE